MGRSNHAARWLRERWQRAGWADGRAILVGHPVFVWLTGRGTKAVGIEHPLWRPTPGALAHITAVNEVRIHVQARHPDAAWVSERELRRADPRLRVHRPDGLVAVGEREVAIEVELTQKERRRTARIMCELTAGYESVTYFAAPAPRRVLSGLAEKVGQGRVQVLPLPGEGSDESP
jgi:hypothetical protein